MENGPGKMMARVRGRAVAGLLFVAFVVARFEWSAAATTSGAVATVHPIATRAALDAFDRGGNAIDAAIAAGLMLGVVDGHNSGIGGGCFILARLANGSVMAIDGRETAPEAATRDMFIREGRAVPELSLEGPLASGVPGELAAFDLLAREHGRLPLSDHLERAARVAETGFTISASYAGRLRGEAEVMRRFPATRAIFLDAAGEPLRAGALLRQTDLAATYRALAAYGVNWFYNGPFAEKTEAWMRENGGILTRRDFASYRPRLREPVRTRYRDCEILGFPPPSSGGAHVAQILNILETFPTERLKRDSDSFAHLTVEAMKAAFADRAHWLGDPDFAPVPLGLVSDAYARELAGRIRLDRASEVAGPGQPPGGTNAVFGGGKHTTHWCAADDEGNWVAITATVNTSFGSKVVIPGTGVVLNNQMDDFAAQPGVPNFFGLVGAEANAVEAGKRPLSSMSPTLALRDGKPWFAVGAAGGPTIISQVALAILARVDSGAGVAESIALPRLHHQWRPADVVVEKGWPAETIAGLERRGHGARVVESLGAAQAIGYENGQWFAAADPRVDTGTAAVWSANREGTR